LIEDEAETVQEEDNENNVGDNVPVIPGEDPRLRPHGQVYEDLGEVTIDPSANSKYTLPFRVNWGGAIINRQDPISCLNYFLVLFPMTFLVSDIIPNMNNNLRGARKPVTSKAEMLRFFGITLAMALDPTRGGVRAYWDQDDIEHETIYSKRDYGNRFFMTRHRFEDLRRYLSFSQAPDDIVSNLYIYIIFQ